MKEIHECTGGRGTGQTEEQTICKPCLGAGWTWPDGVPPTFCPGGGRRPPFRHPSSRPCGRAGLKCPGCDRLAAIIPAAEDIAATLDRRRAAQVPLATNDANTDGTEA